MRPRKFSEEMIVKILNEASEGNDLDTICDKYAISYGTYYKWKSKYENINAESLDKIKQLEINNINLKSMYKKICAENKILQDAIEGKF